MNNTITVPGRSINTITAEIVSIANQAGQVMFLSALEMGKRLIEAKGLCSHGEWGEYLSELCDQLGISDSTAHNWMRLHKQYSDNPNFQALGNLTYTNAVKLLALPEETRETLVRDNDVQTMTSRELSQAIKDLTAAREMLAVAQDNATAAEQKADDRQKEIDRLNAALNKATAAEEKAKKKLADLKTKPAPVSAEQVEKIASEAAEQARKEFEEQIARAQEEAAAKEEARMDMEKALIEVQRQLAEAKKPSALANPDMAAFDLLFTQVQEDFNKLQGYLMKIKANDSDLGGKCMTALRTLLDNQRSRVA